MGFLVESAQDEAPPWASKANFDRRRRLHELSDLTDLKPAAWAVRYALSIVEHVVVGTCRLERLVDLARGVEECDKETAHWLVHGGQMPSCIKSKGR